MTEQFRPGDLVELPSGRLAKVVDYHKFEVDMLDCLYEDEPQEAWRAVLVRAKLVHLVSRDQR